MYLKHLLTASKMLALVPMLHCLADSGVKHSHQDDQRLLTALVVTFIDEQRELPVSAQLDDVGVHTGCQRFLHNHCGLHSAAGELAGDVAIGKHFLRQLREVVGYREGQVVLGDELRKTNLRPNHLRTQFRRLRTDEERSHVWLRGRRDDCLNLAVCSRRPVPYRVVSGRPMQY